jgi:PPOX class probable FMN-dependent enzyme
MIIDTNEKLESIYGDSLAPAAVVKELDHLPPFYADLIAASPFVALATCGPEGLDCSPRGDYPGFVVVKDEKTLILPDRRGNNRIDSLRNIVRDPRVALLFLIPGSGTTFRVNGRAVISVDPALLESFAIQGNVPRSAIVVTVEVAYFQCARAVMRSHLWDPKHHVSSSLLPSPGTILAAISNANVGGEQYDLEWPGRAAATMW